MTRALTLGHPPTAAPVTDLTPHTSMRFQNICLVALLLVGALPSAGQAQTQTDACPSEAPKMRRIATRFASAPMYQEMRSMHRVATTDSAQVRTLSVAQGDDVR